MDSGVVDEVDGFIAPVIKCWPMGFGWISYVAQATMVSSCFRSGFAQCELLSDERLLLPDAGRAVAVATLTSLFRCPLLNEQQLTQPPWQI